MYTGEGAHAKSTVAVYCTIPFQGSRIIRYYVRRINAPEDIGAHLYGSIGENRNLFDKDGSRKTIHTLHVFKI